MARLSVCVHIESMCTHFSDYFCLDRDHNFSKRLSELVYNGLVFMCVLRLVCRHTCTCKVFILIAQSSMHNPLTHTTLCTGALLFVSRENEDFSKSLHVALCSNGLVEQLGLAVYSYTMSVNNTQASQPLF